MEDSLKQYILDIVDQTRKHDSIELALSPRASIAMVRTAKAMALIQKRDYVIPDDIKSLCVPVFSHRLKLKKQENYKGQQAEDLLKQLIERIHLPIKEHKR
jgi:MoxR-like ATPase